MNRKRILSMSLFGATLLCAQTAIAQPLGGFCDARPTINSVKYLGKVSGDDQVEVLWSTEATSSCIKFGLPVNLPRASEDSFVPSQPSGYSVKVTVKRRFGDLDDATATIKEVLLANSNVRTVVKVPRKTLATDPEHYAVEINVLSGGASQRRAILTGSGLPNFASATQTSLAFPSLQGAKAAAAECFPDVQIAGLTFVGGSAGTPDALTVNWNAARASTSCLGLLVVSISARVRRGNGPEQQTNVDGISGNASSQILQLKGRGQPITSYKIVVAVSTNFAAEVKALKHGDF